MRDPVPSRTGLPLPLIVAAAALVLLTAVCFGLIAYCSATPAWNMHPYNISGLDEYFPDLLLFQRRFDFFHTRQFFTYTGATPFMYPAPDAVVYKVFYTLAGSEAVPCFITCAVLVYVVTGAAFVRSLARRGVPLVSAALLTLAVLLCSYPVWFEIKQANLEIAVWVLIAAGLASFLSNRGYLAAVCFCLAGSMKLYPVIFLGLLLQRRQWKQAAAGLGVFLVATVASVWLLCPDLLYCWHGIAHGVDQFHDLYILRLRIETTFDHSLFVLFKYHMRPVLEPWRVTQVLNRYMIVVGVLGVVLFFVRIRLLPVLNQILALTIASILLPPTSFEYTLQHMLVPFALFALLLVDATRKRVTLPAWRAFLLCFVILLAPIPELIHNTLRLDGRVKALTLLALFLLSVAVPLQLPGKGESTNQETPEDFIAPWEYAEPSTLPGGARRLAGQPASW